MDRIEKVRKVVDGILLAMSDNDERRCAYVHLYGAAQAAAFIAQKRRDNVELTIIAAMLHDIYSYKSMDSQDHAHKGAVMAKVTLEELRIFSGEEISRVCLAIYRHSDKERIAEAFDEVLKDADVMQHILYNPLSAIKAAELKRFINLKKEFGII